MSREHKLKLAIEHYKDMYESEIQIMGDDYWKGKLLLNFAEMEGCEMYWDELDEDWDILHVFDEVTISELTEFLINNY